MIRKIKNKFISEMFFKYFEVTVVETREELSAAQRVRHLVYQNEKNWLKQTNTARDACSLDEDSIHILVKSKSLDRYVGTVRLCINKKHNNLPFKSFYSDLEIDHSYVDLSNETDSVYCEISRLTIIKANRSKSKIENINISNFEKNLFKVCAPALLGAATVIFDKLNFKASVFMTETSVAKLGKKEGFNFHRIGEDKEHCGARGLYVIRASDLESMRKGSTISGFVYKKLLNKLSLNQPLIPVYEYNKATKEVINNV